MGFAAALYVGLKRGRGVIKMSEKVKNFHYPDTQAFNYVKNYLENKGIEFLDIAKISQKLSSKYFPNVSLNKYLKDLLDIMHKRDVLDAYMVGISLDKLSTDKQLDEPLQSILDADAGVFSIDEILGESIANLYGSIGSTDFGYIDHNKQGIIKRIDELKSTDNVFLDDLLGATAAALSAKTSHDNS